MIIALGLLGLVGVGLQAECQQNIADQKEWDKINPDATEEMARMFIYDQRTYGFMVGNDVMTIQRHRSDEVSYIADVPADKPMWFVCRNPSPKGYICRGGLEAHLHTPRDVAGAGETHSHGKFGSDNNLVIPVE